MVLCIALTREIYRSRGGREINFVVTAVYFYMPGRYVGLNGKEI